MGIVKDMISKLNPFQCAILEVEKDDELFIEICDYIDLELIEVETKAEVYIEDFDATLKILRLSDDWYDIAVVKGKSGILGH